MSVSVHLPLLTLDVTGTVRTTGLTLTGNGAASGDVIVGNSVGVGTWMPVTTLPAAALNSGSTNEVAYYSASTTLPGNTAFESNGTNVGIGTTLLTTAALTVMNGNVGIGTWIPDKTVYGDRGYLSQWKYWYRYNIRRWSW